MTEQSTDGSYLDLGASWIHGIDHNPIKYLAEKYDVETKQFDNFISFALYDKDGNLLYLSEEEHFVYDEKEEDYVPICDGTIKVNELYCDIYELNLEFYDFYIDEKKNIISNNGEDISVEESVKNFIQKKIEEGKELTEAELEELNFALVWWLEGDYAADTSEISLLSWEEMGHKMEGSEVIFPKGYRQIIDGLADGLDIRLEHIVTEVDYSGDLVRIKTTKGDFNAKYVISTLPLGVLQSDVVTFSPSLPPEKQKAIKTLGMGILNKVYYVFDEVFWDEEKERDWIIQIPAEKGHWVYFANLNGVLEKPVLLAFNTATFGRQLETMNEEDIVKEGLLVLENIYGDKLPEPVFTKATKWGSDEFSFGSYSYTGVGSTNHDFYELSKPIKNKIFFAGEATEVNYPATVHGAFFSGMRDANRIQWLEGNQLSPKEQYDNWILNDYILCKGKLKLYIIVDSQKPVCIQEKTKNILENRNWVFDEPYYQ